MEKSKISCFQDRPKGMLPYDDNVLTVLQQTKMNSYVLNDIKQNVKYLTEHPEVRGIISLLLRYILRKRPRNVHEAVHQFFFSRSKLDLARDVREYIESKKAVKEKQKEENILVDEEGDEVIDEILLEPLQEVPISVLNEIIIGSMKRLGIDDKEEPDESSINLVAQDFITEILDKIDPIVDDNNFDRE